MKNWICTRYKVPQLRTFTHALLVIFFNQKRYLLFSVTTSELVLHQNGCVCTMVNMSPATSANNTRNVRRTDKGVEETTSGVKCFHSGMGLSSRTDVLTKALTVSLMSLKRHLIRGKRICSLDSKRTYGF